MTTCQLTDCGARTDGFMCTGHGAQLRRTLEEIPGLMHDLSILATGQARVYRRNGRPVPVETWDIELDRIPTRLRSRQAQVALPATRGMVNLAARTKLDDTWTTLTVWARWLLQFPPGDTNAAGPVCVRCGHPSCQQIAPLRPPLTAGTLCDWIRERVNAARYVEDGLALYASITRMRGEIVRMVDRAPSRVYAGPCHAPTAAGRCERPLFAWPGDGDIVCDGFALESAYDVGCRAVHTRGDRAEWLLAELDDRLATLAFWQQWLPQLRDDLTWPNRSTWWRWRDTSRLEVKSIDREARELYRGGDVLALVAREQPRIRRATEKRRQVSA